MGIVFLLTIFVLGLAGLCIAAGLWLRRQGRSSVADDPVCGSCGYNLRGATGNRCPECGKLFIEAGVYRRAAREAGSRRIATALIVVPLIFFLLAGLGAVTSAIAIYRARQARAAAAQQAAAAAQVAAFQSAMAKQAQKNTLARLVESMQSPARTAPLASRPASSTASPNPDQ